MPHATHYNPVSETYAARRHPGRHTGRWVAYQNKEKLKTVEGLVGTHEAG